MSRITLPEGVVRIRKYHGLYWVTSINKSIFQARNKRFAERVMESWEVDENRNGGSSIKAMNVIAIYMRQLYLNA